MRSAYFEFLNTRRETDVKKQKSPAVGSFYVNPVVTLVPTSSSLALEIFDFLITYEVCKKRKYCFSLFYTLFLLLI